MKKFKEFVESSNIEHENIMQHMAKGDYNVHRIRKIGDVTHVTLNNLPTEKSGHVPEHEVHKAQSHLNKLGLGDNHLVGTTQTISTTSGGRFGDKRSEE